jgi:hypothetical protein
VRVVRTAGEDAVSFDLGDYKEVSERIVDLFEKHPDASLRPANPDEPFKVVTIGDKVFIAYAAACYRTPDDPHPAIGVAWEPFPGKTSYTKDSELQNAETSAWGRAIIAAGASTAKGGVASATEVRNRQADDGREEGPAPKGGGKRCSVCEKPLAGSKAVMFGSGPAHEKCAAEGAPTDA